MKLEGQVDVRKDYASAKFQLDRTIGDCEVNCRFGLIYYKKFLFQIENSCERYNFKPIRIQLY